MAIGICAGSAWANHSKDALEPAPVLQLERRSGPLLLRGQTQLWLDPSGQATADQAMQSARNGKFNKVHEPKPVNLHPNGALWQRFEVKIKADGSHWFLQMQSPSIDHVSLHWQNAAGAWQSSISGDSIAVANWPIIDSVPLLPLPADVALQPDGVSEYWLRIAHKRLPIWVDAFLISHEGLHRQRGFAYLMFGGFVGLVLLAAIVCVQHIAVVRDPAFFAYLVMMVSMCLVQLQLTGLGGQYFFNNSAFWNDVLSFAFAPMYAAAAFAFVAVVTGITKLSPTHGRACIAWVALAFVFIAGEVLAPTKELVIAANVYMLLCLVILIAMPLWAHSRGERNAKWVLWGMAPALIGSSLPLLRNQGILPTGFLSQYGPMFGATLELVILLLVLVRRSQQQQETAVRALAMTSTDPLTGLAHESLFLRRLTDALTRCRRHGHECALLLIDLHTLDTVTRGKGSRARERALVLAASRIRSTARDVDSVARVGKNQFALLFEGPVTARQSKNVSSRLQARLLQPTNLVDDWGLVKFRLQATQLPMLSSVRVDPSVATAETTLDNARSIVAQLLERATRKHATGNGANPQTGTPSGGVR